MLRLPSAIDAVTVPVEGSCTFTKMMTSRSPLSYLARWKTLLSYHMYMTQAESEYEIVTSPDGSRHFLTVYKNVPQRESYETFFRFFVREWNCLPKDYSTADALAIIGRVAAMLQFFGINKVALKDIPPASMPVEFRPDGRLKKVRQPGSCIVFEICSEMMLRYKRLIRAMPYLSEMLQVCYNNPGLSELSVEKVPGDVYIIDEENNMPVAVDDDGDEARWEEQPQTGWADLTADDHEIQRLISAALEETVWSAAHVDEATQDLAVEIVQSNQQLWEGIGEERAKALLHDMLSYLYPDSYKRNV